MAKNNDYLVAWTKRGEAEQSFRTGTRRKAMAFAAGLFENEEVVAVSVTFSLALVAK